MYRTQSSQVELDLTILVATWYFLFCLFSEWEKYCCGHPGNSSVSLHHTAETKLDCNTVIGCYLDKSDFVAFSCYTLVLRFPPIILGPKPNKLIPHNMQFFRVSGVLLFHPMRAKISPITAILYPINMKVASSEKAMLFPKKSIKSIQWNLFLL